MDEIGHNGGPPLDDDEPPGKLLFVQWSWRQARQAAFKAPTHEIALFRLARAEAAGLSYDAYVAQLLDTGRYDQTGEKPKPRNRPDTIPKSNTTSAAGQNRRLPLQTPAQSPHAGQVRNRNGRFTK
jgi:hypothetical protein